MESKGCLIWFVLMPIKHQLLMGVADAINARYPDGSRWQTYGAYTNLNYIDSRESGFSIQESAIPFTALLRNLTRALFAVPCTRKLNNSDGALNGTIGLVYNPNSEVTNLY